MQRIALMDAEEVFMPLSRTLAAALSKRPVPDLGVSPSGAQRMNTLIRRAASRFLIAHPEEDVRRAAL